MLSTLTLRGYQLFSSIAGFDQYIFSSMHFKKKEGTVIYTQEVLNEKLQDFYGYYILGICFAEGIFKAAYQGETDLTVKIEHRKREKINNIIRNGTFYCKNLSNLIYHIFGEKIPTWENNKNNHKIVITSKSKLYKFIIKNGGKSVNNRKYLKFPFIEDDENMICFLRGFYESNGGQLSISSAKCKNKSIELQFKSFSADFLEGLRCYFKETLGIEFCVGFKKNFKKMQQTGIIYQKSKGYY